MQCANWDGIKKKPDDWDSTGEKKKKEQGSRYIEALLAMIVVEGGMKASNDWRLWELLCGC